MRESFYFPEEMSVVDLLRQKYGAQQFNNVEIEDDSQRLHAC